MIEKLTDLHSQIKIAINVMGTLFSRRFHSNVAGSLFKQNLGFRKKKISNRQVDSVCICIHCIPSTLAKEFGEQLSFDS